MKVAVRLLQRFCSHPFCFRNDLPTYIQAVATTSVLQTNLSYLFFVQVLVCLLSFGARCHGNAIGFAPSKSRLARIVLHAIARRYINRWYKCWHKRLRQKQHRHHSFAEFTANFWLFSPLSVTKRKCFDSFIPPLQGFDASPVQVASHARET